jgi:guanylate kinase
VQYANRHPELRQILNDFLSSLLLEQPQNIYDYARQYFSFFNISKDKPRHRPVVVTGPQGAGKTSLVTLLIQANPALFEKSISFTTRQPREGEVNGKDYFFVTEDEFKKELTKGAFTECNTFEGNHYGIHRGKLNDIIARGKVCLMDIDVAGSRRVIENGLDAHFLYIAPPSPEELRGRLLRRGFSEEEVQLKVSKAAAEAELVRGIDKYIHITNSELEATLARAKNHLKPLYPEIYII